MGRLIPQKRATAGAYFSVPASGIEFIPSGAVILDCAVAGASAGGAWPLGRIVNVVGDKSTGKTLLAIEACANFAAKFPKGKIYYREAESAFDQAYAGALGMPLKRVDFGSKDAKGVRRTFDTIEDVFEDLTRILDSDPNTESLYIIDSLDALSDREEMKRKIDEGSYALGKQKLLGQLFRRLVRKLEASRICVLIISQIRDNIGVTFGEKSKRVGGKSMDFYCSQVVWLYHKETIKKTINKIERVVGVRIRARVKKNKMALPFRECEFEIQFGFGIDDLAASLEWLIEVGRADTLFAGAKPATFLKAVEALSQDEYRSTVADVGTVVREAWAEIETTFLPTRKKYGN